MSELDNVRQELLERGDETVSFRQLVERFDEVEEYFNGTPWNLKQIYTNFNILIGKKPCEDCVSREEAILVMCRNCADWQTCKLNCIRVQAMRNIEKLPPVQPKQKTGHWEYVQYGGSCGNWHCSECRMIIPHMPEETNNKPIYKWCPMCGAKMQEVQNDV